MHHLSLQSNDSKSCLLFNVVDCRPSAFALATFVDPRAHPFILLCSPFQKKEAQQTYEEQLPHSLKVCVSECFFCPAVPSAWLNCMQALSV